MSAENTLIAISQFCRNSSGNNYRWDGNSGTYQWSLGRKSKNGTVNGVVRKLAGVDTSNKEIWVVAGSFKIDPNGTILRFTGITKKQQEVIQGVANMVITMIKDTTDVNASTSS